MKRAVLAAVIALLGCLCSLHAQGASQSRRILFDTFVPIAARIQPGDRQIVVESAQPTPDVAYPEEGAFVARLVQKNPIIFTGRVVGKQPVFLRLLAGQKPTEVSTINANWIGSRITVMVERIIQAVDEFSLTILQRLTFIEDGDGTATIYGVRIDAETPWLDQIQQGRRYLISGRIKNAEFSSTGMWMEPANGGNMKPRFQDPYLGRPKMFEQWTIDQATDSLELEVERRRLAH